MKPLEKLIVMIFKSKAMTLTPAHLGVLPDGIHIERRFSVQSGQK